MDHRVLSCPLSQQSPGIAYRHMIPEEINLTSLTLFCVMNLENASSMTFFWQISAGYDAIGRRGVRHCQKSHCFLVFGDLFIQRPSWYAFADGSKKQKNLLVPLPISYLVTAFRKRSSCNCASPVSYHACRTRRIWLWLQIHETDFFSAQETGIGPYSFFSRYTRNLVRPSFSDVLSPFLTDLRQSGNRRHLR